MKSFLPASQLWPDVERWPRTSLTAPDRLRAGACHSANSGSWDWRKLKQRPLFIKISPCCHHSTSSFGDSDGTEHLEGCLHNSSSCPAPAASLTPQLHELGPEVGQSRCFSGAAPLNMYMWGPHLSWPGTTMNLPRYPEAC